MTIARTGRQREIMNLVLAAADKGTFLSVGEVRLALKDPPKGDAMSCSLRFLEKHGMITRKNTGHRREIIPTPQAYAWFRVAHV